VFNQGEVLDGDARYTGSYQSNGSVNPFNYPVYYPLVQGFVGNASMQGVVDMVGQVRGNFTDGGLAGVFIDNHDNPRFESYTSDAAVSGATVGEDRAHGSVLEDHERTSICFGR
jgi:alpha-amylase